MNAEVFESSQSLRAQLALARESGQRVAVVPTMGALHDGHLSLIKEARAHAQKVVVTIFVNPTQFAANEDLSKYPRDLDGDVRKCESAGASYVFAPKSIDVMYTPGDETRVRVPKVAEHFEGAVRPHHFEGVATVCTKIFNIVGPCVAVFGRKDFQQFTLIKRLVRDLFLPVEIVGVRTDRESDGLARSSRNVYLNTDERLRAKAMPLAIKAAFESYQKGERCVGTLMQAAQNILEKQANHVDYVACASSDTLQPMTHESTIQADCPVVLLLAARFGSTRLIDNHVFGEDAAPVTS